MIKYCTNCLFPDTKPDLQFDSEGLCTACSYFNNRPKIDWDKRYDELLKIVEKYRKKDNGNWDCIVPSSGGKDSTAQALRARELGLNTLIVTATTCDLSDIGRRNIDNLKNLGFDCLELSPNKKIRNKLNKIGLTQVGDISWPEHVGIFTIPIRVAVQMNIPLLLWGENSQNEYGGPASDSDNNILNRRWLEEFGGLLGLRVSDVIGMEEIKKEDLIPYEYPTDKELKRVGVTGLFLGYYIPWDGFQNTLLAQAHGFETLTHHTEASFVNYENLDNHQTGIHDYFKYLKFGFSRSTDIANVHIRRGRLKRKDALEIIKKTDGKFPWSYLGKSLDEILKPLGISINEFIKICDRFTTKRLFKTDTRGNLIKDKEGNLTKINYDNEN
jgi:N-acetyl sugar amidotransferase